MCIYKMRGGDVVRGNFFAEKLKTLLKKIAFTI